jgi:hypothetical protein
MESVAGEEGVSAGDVEALRRARYAKLRTALPFPELDWTIESTDENTIKLRNYAESLAYSAIDWYLEKKRGKKRFARILHWATYISAGLAAAGPLLKVSAFFEIPFVKSSFPDALNSCNSIAAELTVFFAAIAGGFALLDRAGGYTADWMRYMTTAARLNQELVKFQFAWEQAEWTAHKSKEPLDSDPVQNRIDLARDFCSRVLEMVGEETSIWTEELKQRAERTGIHAATKNKL